MKTKLLIQIAAGLLLFFAVGHGMGHISRHDVQDAKAKEVLKMMMENKFDMFGVRRSYDENYTGMSWNLIITLIALSVLLLQLATQSEKQPHLVKSLLVPISLAALAFGVTSFLYFFLVPAVTCTLAFALMVVAMLKIKTTGFER